MLTSVQLLTPPEWPTFLFPVIDAGPDDFLYVRDIDGIDQVDAAVNTTPYGGQADGEFLGNVNVGKRNIVLTMELNHIDEARNFLNLWFKTKSAVTLRFWFDDREPVDIDGVVEKSGGDRFSQEPETQISIICPKPFFRSIEDQERSDTSGITPAFTTAEYEGFEINGFELVLEVGATAYSGDVIVEHQHTSFPGYSRTFTVEDVDLAIGSVFTLSTLQGNKFVKSDVLGSLLGHMSNDSVWLTVWPGDNLIRVKTPSSGIARDWTITYRELFGGI